MTSRDVHALVAELAGWAELSGRAPSTLAYGDGPDQIAELLLPDGSGPHRVAVLLHGGFWRAAFTRTTMAALAVDLAERGVATWNVEYRRVGTGGGVPETLDDVRAAIAMLPAIDAPLRLDRVLVVGHSAGGQLALCVADAPLVTTVVSLAGVCDLRDGAADEIGDGAVLEFIGATPAEAPDAYAIADPVAQLPVGANVLLVHGDADQRVPIEQSRRYARAAVAAGSDCELMELAGVDHFALIDPRSAAWAAVASRLVS
ncbi:MAG: alpha/beta fold hydrolase [Solirubrobacteraceae bacterium]